MGQVTETWAFSQGDGWTDEDDLVLQRVLLVLGLTLNNIDNTNIADSAGIQLAKIDCDSALEHHAWTHHAGYSTFDELDNESISGAMIMQKSIGPWHIGINAVTQEHMSADDTLENCFYVDPSALGGTDGTVVDPPLGFDNRVLEEEESDLRAHMVLLLAGMNANSGASDASINHLSLSNTPSGSGVAIHAKSTREDESETGSITEYYHRMAWK